jgi:holo-[acyl-carrier protein] synthase
MRGFGIAAPTGCCSLIDRMILGSGIDLVEIGRIKQSMERYGQRFLDRIYTAAEQAYCLRKRNAAESLAARFAAKEAGAKALGTGISRGVNWLEIEVSREPGGRPALRFHGRAAEIAARLGVAHAALSITHTDQLSMASVVLEDGR